MASFYSLFMRLVGVLLCIATYVLIATNVYAYLKVIILLLKKRLGVTFGLIWIGIGVSLLYNIIFNHFMAMIIKPGGPKELVSDEQLRKEIKNKETRKAARVAVNEGEDGKVTKPNPDF